MPVSVILPVAFALATSLLLSRLAIAWAGRLGFLDPPGARKIQLTPVPLLGGLAIVLAFALGLLLIGRGSAGQTGDASCDALFLRWLLGGVWLAVVGLLDDRRGLGARTRLAAQLLAVALLAPELQAWLRPGWLALLIGGLWMLGLINALNFLDNMDLIAGSTGLWTLLAAALILALAGQSSLAAAALCLSGALLGFLWWNRPPARLYMGDAGSTFLGYSLGLVSLLAVSRGSLSPWLAPLLVALPLYDTATVLWIRLREGRALWVGDRRHVTHRLLDRGASVWGAVRTLNLWTLGAAGLAAGLFAWDRWEWIGLLLGIAAAAALFNWERRCGADGKADP